MKISEIPVTSSMYQNRDLAIWDLIYIVLFKRIFAFQIGFLEEVQTFFLGLYV